MKRFSSVFMVRSVEETAERFDKLRGARCRDVRGGSPPSCLHEENSRASR